MSFQTRQASFSPRIRASVVGAAALAIALVACGSSGRQAYDDPGASGPGAADGKGSTTFGTDPSLGSGADGGGGGSGDGQGCAAHAEDSEGCPCPQLGAVRDCYTGPPSSRATGICKDGQQTCAPKDELGGAWSACGGATTPAV